MSLGIRKLIVLGLVAGIFLLGNILIVAHWLAEQGLIDFARSIRSEYLTGTAVTIILVLLILLVGPARQAWNRHCPVCDHRLKGGNYCSDCGSKVRNLAST